eukprot:5518834-Pleurochrysis_carterae.AAC.1
MPSSLLRNFFTSGCSSSMPAPASASSVSLRYASHRSCSSAFRLSPSASATYLGGGTLRDESGRRTTCRTCCSALRPHLVSTSKALRSAASAARRSPLVSAPSA